MYRPPNMRNKQKNTKLSDMSFPDLMPQNAMPQNAMQQNAMPQNITPTDNNNKLLNVNNVNNRFSVFDTGDEDEEEDNNDIVNIIPNTPPKNKNYIFNGAPQKEERAQEYELFEYYRGGIKTKVEYYDEHYYDNINPVIESDFIDNDDGLKPNYVYRFRKGHWANSSIYWKNYKSDSDSDSDYDLEFDENLETDTREIDTRLE